MTRPPTRKNTLQTISDRLPGKTLLAVVAIFSLLFLTLPIIALVIRAVQAQAWAELGGSGLISAVILSLLTTLITALLTVTFGTPLAYFLARRDFTGKRLASVLIELPVVLPPAVAGLGLLVAFGRRGLFGPTFESLGWSLPFSTAAVIIAQTFVAAPFYIRAAQNAFQTVDPEIEAAGRVDGAGGLSLFWEITLPLTSRSLGAGLALSWARALGEFGATILFAGSLQGITQTMPLLIYKEFERNINSAIWAGVLLVGFALAALLLARYLGRSDA
ncbi:MAG: ABC transporter permease [Chloroflexi bacterium]|nr:ABC transporter permease [Chloroflexota bacterium]MCC6892430.1 molybdate ABC transporter permease subunit [Anaerolineae bacterium]